MSTYSISSSYINIFSKEKPIKVISQEKNGGREERETGSEGESEQG
jgi:hypothetical protein